MRNLPKRERGQAILLVLLSMAVIVTVVLSIVSRSITDIKVTSTEEDSLRAFSAAEAGVEQVLITGTSDYNVVVGDAKAVAEKTDFAKGLAEFVLPEEYNAGESATVWFVSHDANGNIVDRCDTANPCYKTDNASRPLPIKICWGKEGTGADIATTPALEASVFYTTTDGYGSVKVARITADPYDSRRLNDNKFDLHASDGSCRINGVNYAFSVAISDLGSAPYSIPASTKMGTSGSGRLQFMKVRILYNTDLAHKIGVNNGGGVSNLPSQGIEINSAGTSGEANRKIQIIQGYPEPSEIFNNAVFSGAVQGISH